jgi:hypothetical protein
MKKTIIRQFGELGFRKRSGLVFTKVLTLNVLGWVGLNSTSGNGLPRGVVGLHPVVGVRHQDVERLVAELNETKFHSYVPPTVARPLIDLTSEKRYRAWVFQRDLEDETATADMVSTVVRYGLPFMLSLVSHEALSVALQKSEQLDKEQRTSRQSALALLMGDNEQAGSLTNNLLAELTPRVDAAAHFFRRFAQNLLRRALSQ